MNVALTVPFVGFEVADSVAYAALAALIITVLLSILWKSLGKGALVAILALGAIIVFAMTR